MSALFGPSFFVRSLRAEQVLEETNEYVLKARNAPVPVQVQEVFRGNLDGEKNNCIVKHPLQIVCIVIAGTSMKIHDGGWAWVVSGCKAYLWRHSLKQTTVCVDTGLVSTHYCYCVFSESMFPVHTACHSRSME